MSAKKILFGVVAGITAGTLLGVMITSKKNIAFRKKLLGKGEVYLGVVNKKFNRLLKKFSKGVNRLEEKTVAIKKVAPVNDKDNLVVDKTIKV